ncbi:hypothetical protein EWM64_g44 [Hericium alpestre]|uniref:Uncharacterized protein n=1 Tax=Hericium alpestre TaxID=135208 RepID=A0A4Z0ACC6_9AGAM|nr:hypothetical protein EWM64_g44 [Hericium alpestre]
MRGELSNGADLDACQKPHGFAAAHFHSFPRGIAMAKVNVSGYGQALAQGFGDPIDGLYTNNATAPLGAGLGMRQFYEFGLYTYCGYTSQTPQVGICTNHTTARRYEPYEAITSDMLSNYSLYTDAIIVGTTFRDSGSTGTHTHSAYYLLLLGTIFCGLALVLGVIKHTVTFLASAFFALVATLFVLAGAALWTTALNQTEDINRFVVGGSIPLGITVSIGTGLYLAWAAFACLFVSCIPYVISTCTYRG